LIVTPIARIPRVALSLSVVALFGSLTAPATLYAAFEIADVTDAGDDGFQGYTRVWLAYGDNAITAEEWDTYEPSPGYIRNTARNLEFNDENTLSSPGLPEPDIEVETIDGYTWKFIAQTQSAMWPYTETAFPGTINAYHAAFATVTPPAGTIRFSSNEKNQEMIWWAREGNSPEGSLIQRYFITDEWGNRYIMGTTGVENDADIATSFNSTVLPQGWTKSIGNLAENLILAPAYGAGDQAHFNLFRESADNAFFQFEWGVSGSSVAAQIAGMPIWGGPASDAILGRVGDDNLIHGAEGDDVISALGNNDDIYGDIGTDTVVLQGLLSDYQVLGWAEQGAELRLFGFGVTKSLRDTEFLRFSDGSMIATSAVPEPSTYAMALAGLACGGYTMWRRRRRA
jgi:hypothetical protein